MNQNQRLLSTFILSLSASIFATTASAAGKKPVVDNVPPPPGINDPGVGSQPAAATAPAQATATEDANTDPLAPLPRPDARLVRDKASRDAAATAQRVAASDISTHKQGNDTVEEYRQHGHVWMIRIVHENGPPQTFMASDASGRLIEDPHQGPVAPVYFTLYEWQ